MKLQPLGNKVVVRLKQPAKTTPGGIILPDKALEKERPKQGTVVSIGPEVGMKSRALPDPLGGTSPAVLKTGDVVLFNAFAGSDINVGEGADEERFTVMLEDDILAILVPEPRGKTSDDIFGEAASSLGKKPAKK